LQSITENGATYSSPFHDFSFDTPGELNYADALFVRAGMNQRYWTAGLELSIVNYQFQAASYGEEIGDDVTPREDRRYVVKFAFRF
jgi:hypothetical protein